MVTSTPGCTLPPGKTRYPLYRWLGGPQGRSGREENLVPIGIRSRTVQPVAQSLYRLSYPAHISFRYTMLKLRVLAWCSQVSCFCGVWNAHLLQTLKPLNYNVLPEVLLYIHYWHFISSCKQISILNWKWILRFVMGLSFQVNNEY